MKKVRINASRSYDVLIGRDILKDSGELISEVISPCKAVVIGDSNTLPLYGEVVSSSLRTRGFQVLSFSFPAGEESKSPELYIELLEHLASLELTRGDLLLALGGGVTGDLVGFVAATYLRGISYIQIPTTLLSSVDSSVGGKTAINIRAGKNLVGAFYQPRLVICDCNTFSTLSEDIYIEGLAEAIKYGVIDNKELFDLFKEDTKATIEDIVKICVEMKGALVKEDEFDLGKRQLLNLGHTIGHGIEKCSGFKIPHGYGVAIGMAMVTRASEKLGLCAIGTSKELEAVLTLNNLPTETSYTSEALAKAALMDKKRKGSQLTLVIPKAIGHCILHRIPLEELKAFITSGRRNQ